MVVNSLQFMLQLVSVRCYYCAVQTSVNAVVTVNFCVFLTLVLCNKYKRTKNCFKGLLYHSPGLLVKALAMNLFANQMLCLIADVIALRAMTDIGVNSKYMDSAMVLKMVW